MSYKVDFPVRNSLYLRVHTYIYEYVYGVTDMYHTHTVQ